MIITISIHEDYETNEFIVYESSGEYYDEMSFDTTKDAIDEARSWKSDLENKGFDVYENWTIE